jgi:hypothetical protein
MVFVCMLILSCLAFGQRVRLREGTPLRVRLKADLASDQVAEGARVDFEVARPVFVQGMLVIPGGAVAWGAVQSVKKGKFIKFDIEGVRLSDLTEVRLRTTREKSKNLAKDQIKVDSEFNGGVGAPKGAEYTAYVDEDTEVAAAAPLSTPVPATPTPPTPAQVTAPTTPAVTSPPPTVVVPTSAPVTSPPTSPGQVPTPLASVERVRVECFSDPSGADILIDGEFYGNTPSILKVPVGKHELEIQLSGYKTYAVPLILQSGTGIRTVRVSLEQKE